MLFDHILELEEPGAFPTPTIPPSPKLNRFFYEYKFLGRRVGGEKEETDEYTLCCLSLVMYILSNLIYILSIFNFLPASGHHTLLPLGL